MIVILLDTASHATHVLLSDCERQGHHRRLRQAKLAPDLLHTIELHAPNFCLHGFHPHRQALTQFVIVLPTPQLIHDARRHRVHEPHVHMRVEPSTPLSLDGAVESLHRSEETPPILRGDTVGVSTRTGDFHTQDVFQEQLHHQIEEERYAHRVTRGLRIHHVSARHPWRMLLEESRGPHFLITEEHPHHWILCVVEVGCSEYQGRPKH